MRTDMNATNLRTLWPTTFRLETLTLLMKMCDAQDDVLLFAVPFASRPNGPARASLCQCVGGDKPRPQWRNLHLNLKHNMISAQGHPVWTTLFGTTACLPL